MKNYGKLDNNMNVWCKCIIMHEWHVKEWKYNGSNMKGHVMISIMRSRIELGIVDMP